MYFEIALKFYSLKYCSNEGRLFKVLILLLQCVVGLTDSVFNSRLLASEESHIGVSLCRAWSYLLLIPIFWKS